MSAEQRTPRVLNRRTSYDRNPNCVYVGRPTKWGNPFAIGRDGTRGEVVEKYREWIATSSLDPLELRGRDLVCWCAPEPCHADVLLELANVPVCSVCSGSGFHGPGSGYDDVCDYCGGTKYLPAKGASAHD